MGTIQSCKVSADYAAMRFEGKVNLHMVCLSWFAFFVIWSGTSDINIPLPP